MIKIILIFISGILLGLILGWHFAMKFKKSDGILVINEIQEEKRTWELEVNYPLEEIQKKKRLIFSINVIK